MPLLLVLILASSCANAPVQEMSDARLAIRSAEEAGADRYSPQQLNQARELLQQAQLKLEQRAFKDAKRFAVGARDQAIRAREKASAALPTPKP